jgi:hypothetical protein
MEFSTEDPVGKGPGRSTPKWITLLESLTAPRKAVKATPTYTM